MSSCVAIAEGLDRAYETASAEAYCENAHNHLGRARPIAVTLGALWLAGCVAHAILEQAVPTAACGIVAGGLLAVGMDRLARGLRGNPRGKGARL